MSSVRIRSTAAFVRARRASDDGCALTELTAMTRPVATAQYRVGNVCMDAICSGVPGPATILRGARMSFDDVRDDLMLRTSLRCADCAHGTRREDSAPALDGEA